MKKTKKQLLIQSERKEKEKTKWRAGLVPPWSGPGKGRPGAVCSGWSYPIQADHSLLVLGGVQVLPTLRVPPVAQVCRVDGELLRRSLVCIGNVLSLAVVPTALQKLHKCVTQNTTELLQKTTHNMFFKTHLQWRSEKKQTKKQSGSASSSFLLVGQNNRTTARARKGRKCFLFCPSVTPRLMSGSDVSDILAPGSTHSFCQRL